MNSRSPGIPSWRGLLLLSICLTAVVVAAFVAPIAQDSSYHSFTDQRGWAGIANIANVLSNAPFLLAGIAGLCALRTAPLTAVSRRCLVVFFCGVGLTAVGSAGYHWRPDNASLLWDRLPMTLAFVGLTALVISEYLSSKLASRLLWPMLCAGMLSVAYWLWTETRGSGDLRWYLLVQFLPLLIIPLILWLYRGRSDWTPTLIGMLILYVLAKSCELLDSEIYAYGNIISGHSVKHLIAAGASWLPVQFLHRKTSAIKH